MLRKLLAVAAISVISIVLLVVAMYVTNAAPAVPRLQPSDLDGRPFVVKFHAQWCHVCRLTKDVWTDVEAAYSGRVNLVVFDFTNEETTVASRAEAERLGLTPLFQEYEGASGYVVIADGRTKDVLQEIDGSLDFAEYQTAIDAALKRK